MWDQAPRFLRAEAEALAAMQGGDRSPEVVAVVRAHAERGSRVCRLALVHAGIVSAEEAAMMPKLGALQASLCPRGHWRAS